MSVSSCSAAGGRGSVRGRRGGTGESLQAALFDLTDVLVSFGTDLAVSESLGQPLDMIWWNKELDRVLGPVVHLTPQWQAFADEVFDAVGSAVHAAHLASRRHE